MLSSHPELIPFRHREKNADDSSDDNVAKLSSTTDIDEPSPDNEEPVTLVCEGKTSINKNSGALNSIAIKEW